VHAPAQVRGLLGGNVTLQCHLQLLDSSVQVTQVTWMRRQPAGQPSSVAVYHPSRSPWYLDPERVEFVAAMSGGELRNASLVVSQLRVEDEANYTCQFATFPHGSRSASTRLDVIAQPQNTAEAQKVPPGLFTSESVPVARCVSTGGRPRARITWSPDLDGKVNKSEAPGPLPGTFTVTSLLTVAPSSQVDGKSVTCIVEHESLEEPDSLPVNLTVYYPPEVNISGYDGSWYLGQSKASLTCDVRSNPAPTHYHWSTVAGSLSCVSLSIFNSANAVGGDQRPPPTSSDSGMFYMILFLTVVILVLFLLGLLLYCWKFRSAREFLLWNPHLSAMNEHHQRCH
uniref:Ig-like domain-containing protein n=1 Tax=Propithecus coquereli TaxID=379532 RepID=A0A2K6FC54_PROCO